jgi:tRNA A22 N-methylase
MDMVDKSDQTTIPVKDRVEFLTKVYDRMAGLTANADTKAGIILAIGQDGIANYIARKIEFLQFKLILYSVPYC